MANGALIHMQHSDSGKPCLHESSSLRSYAIGVAREISTMVGNLDWLVSELSDEVLVDNEILLHTLENEQGADCEVATTSNRLFQARSSTTNL